MLLNDQLLANIAVHHYSVAVPLPQLLRSFGLRRDARGNGVTGLHADKEAVALGMQDVFLWSQAGTVPDELPTLLRIACFFHPESAGIFEALLEIDRAATRTLFTPFVAHDPETQKQAHYQSQHAVGLLADLTAIAAVQGQFHRVNKLLGLPPAAGLGPVALARLLEKIIDCVGQDTELDRTARAEAERAVVRCCQMPDAKAMPSTYVAKLLVKNCKARSETQELALLCLPQSRGMIAKDILEVMKEAAVNTRLTLLKFLAKLGPVQNRTLSEHGGEEVYDVLYKLTEHANETALGYMLNDLEAFNLPVYLDKTQVLILAAVATRSRCIIDGVKFFSQLPQAKLWDTMEMLDMLDFAAAQRHFCQHNTLAQAVNFLAQRPSGQQMNKAMCRQVMQTALRNGCWAFVRTLQKRWTHLYKHFNSLGKDHLIAALLAAFEHSRCAPEELFKVVAMHPKAKDITAEELAPVLELVCSDTPLGHKDCHNDGCGAEGATAPQVLHNVPGKPLKRLLMLPAVKELDANLLTKVMKVACDYAKDGQLYVSLLTCTHAAAAAVQLAPDSLRAMAQAVTSLSSSDHNSVNAIQNLFRTRLPAVVGNKCAFEVLQSCLEAAGADEHLQRLLRLPAAQRLTQREVAQLLQLASKRHLSMACLRMLKLPHAPATAEFQALARTIEAQLAEQQQRQRQEQKQEQAQKKRKRRKAAAATANNQAAPVAGPVAAPGPGPEAVTAHGP